MRKTIVDYTRISGLKLILKVGGGSSTSTPEHYFENIPAGTSMTEQHSEDIFNSPSSSVQFDAFNKMHKKSKKKKKKKEKDYEKRDKKRKHRKVGHFCESLCILSEVSCFCIQITLLPFIMFRTRRNVIVKNLVKKMLRPMTTKNRLHLRNTTSLQVCENYFENYILTVNFLRQSFSYSCLFD